MTYAIRYRVRIGRLYRVFRGVYSVGRPALTPIEWASAAVLACGPGAALSHGSAMALWGYWRHWDQPYEVILVGDRRTKGIRVHRSTTLRRHDVTKQLGIRVTTPARTIFDISPRQNDKAFKRTVSNALHSLWLTEGQLADAVAWHPRLPARQAGGAVDRPARHARRARDGRTTSPPSASSTDCRRRSWARRCSGYVVDALFVAERVIVELDSKEFHMDPIAFETDRERDAEMLVHGLVTVRATWERIEDRPDREAQRLGAILEAHAPRAA